VRCGALALAACGQDADAVDALAEVLTLACPQGYVRVFADEGPPMAALLTQLIAAQRSGSGFGAVAEVPLGCLARLQSALRARGVAPDAGPGDVDRPDGLVVVAAPEAEVFVGVLEDERGAEDFAGDMDFKTAGTANGITALQMDMKVHGLPVAILKQALMQGKDGRMAQTVFRLNRSQNPSR
jgi:hypothetical protein